MGGTYKGILGMDRCKSWMDRGMFRVDRGMYGVFFKCVLGIFEIQSIQFNVRVNGKGYYQLGQIVCKKWTDTTVILRGTIGIFLYEGTDIK